MMTTNKITFNQLITKLLKNTESYNNYYYLGKDQTKEAYVDQHRKKFQKRIKKVGIEPSIFKENNSFMFHESNLDDVRKILEYDMKSINRRLNGQHIPNSENTLKNDVLFLCTFIEGYLEGQELKEAIERINETLK